MDNKGRRFAKVEVEAATAPWQMALTGLFGIFALVLVGFGLWALGGAIYAAWELFREPESIAYFAKYFLESTKLATLLQSGSEGLAHYLSWMAVVLLLLVIGKLGAWALSAGAQLITAIMARRH